MAKLIGSPVTNNNDDNARITHPQMLSSIFTRQCHPVNPLNLATDPHRSKHKVCKLSISARCLIN